jgi:HEPN domain-containing protein
MTLTMTKPEVNHYARTNQYAMMMLLVAGSDYFASRCCILNMMSSGFRLASEAAEKLLKAYIFLETKEPTKLKGNDRHDPYSLKEELQSALKARDTELDNFDGLLHKLFGHYQSRYPDNKGQGPASSEELPQIDELFIYLIEKLPMPDEVKYRSGFFTELCDSNARQFWRNYYWATERNSLLQTKMPMIEQRYKEVFEHLYPQTG